MGAGRNITSPASRRPIMSFNPRPAWEPGATEFFAENPEAKELVSILARHGSRAQPGFAGPNVG